jgi:hypothetical protein
MIMSLPHQDTPRLTLPAPAKLNLMLHILGRRPDGYHELQTIFQFLDYGDELSFALRDDGDVRLQTQIPDVPHDSNLIVKAARALKEQSGCELGVDIWLKKVLPMGGGNRRRKLGCRDNAAGAQSSLATGLGRRSSGRARAQARG